MTLLQKIRWYLRNRGVLALLKRSTEKLVGLPSSAAPMGPASLIPPPGSARPAAVQPTPQALNAATFVRDHFPAVQPLPVYASPGPGPRINLITDSISSGSLFGGVGTAIILGALLARRGNARLRVITRQNDPKAGSVAQVLRCNGIELKSNVEFVRMSVGDAAAQLDVGPGDRFLTTSWWTTQAVLGSVSPDRVDYLLQEDERMFYSYGDEWLRCSELLARRDIRYIVNTQLLKRHLCQSGLGHMEQDAIAFEPAFPEDMFHHVPRQESSKRILFFYSRPRNDRNLFYRGLEVLDTAVREGIFDPAVWDIVFAGADIPPLRLGGLIEPRALGVLDWSAYGEFVRSVDLGFTLMATPHPSYPPLDLAACGATVLTNKFGLKTDLSGYSANITCVDPDARSLVDGLRAAEKLARNDARRLEHYRRHGIGRSWEQSLEDVVSARGFN